MRCSIVFAKKRQIPSSRGGIRKYISVQSMKEAYLYHIEHNEVDSYIIDPTIMNDGELSTMVDHIHYLNAIIPIIIFTEKKRKREILSRLLGIHQVESWEQITSILEKNESRHRDSNRVQWPLIVEYSSTVRGSMKQAIVLSISSTGCFFRGAVNEAVQKGDVLEMTFHFKLFDFFSEGKIVRLQMGAERKLEGLAVEFEKVSPQTQKCIQEIIDEKILGELMETLKPNNEELQ